MKLQTKYDIGEKVWICYKDRDEVHVYADTIKEIVIVGNTGTSSIKQIEYIGDVCCEGIIEEDIIAYEDSTKLIEMIKKLEQK